MLSGSTYLVLEKSCDRTQTTMSTENRSSPSLNRCNVIAGPSTDLEMVFGESGVAGDSLALALST